MRGAADDRPDKALRRPREVVRGPGTPRGDGAGAALRPGGRLPGGGDLGRGARRPGTPQRADARAAGACVRARTDPTGRTARAGCLGRSGRRAALLELGRRPEGGRRPYRRGTGPAALRRGPLPDRLRARRRPGAARSRVQAGGAPRDPRAGRPPLAGTLRPSRPRGCDRCLRPAPAGRQGGQGAGTRSRDPLRCDARVEAPGAVPGDPCRHGSHGRGRRGRRVPRSLPPGVAVHRRIAGGAVQAGGCPALRLRQGGAGQEALRGSAAQVASHVAEARRAGPQGRRRPSGIARRDVRGQGLRRALAVAA